MKYVLTLVLVFVTPQSSNTFPPLGIVDFYGLGNVPKKRLLDAIPYRLGDTIRVDQFKLEKHDMERNLESIPGVAGASLTLVCCAHEGGSDSKSIIYVGIRETNHQCPEFDPAPTDSVKLTPDVLTASDDYDIAFEKSIQQGNFGEDDSQGHALDSDPEARQIQLQFVRLADMHLMNLKDVLHNSADAHQRAIAAQLLGYAKDKQAIVPYLIAAMRDTDSDVRNNASRALVVFAEYAPNPPGQKINVPAQPFIRMLKSCVWSDRNKSAAAIAQLSATRSPTLLTEVREQALPELFEMAAWKYLGHASYSLEILGRLAGLRDDEIQNDLARGDRTSIVAAAKAMATH